ncbi:MULTISPECIES: c-type cytochrome [unclassified Dinoroseobacter]|uniref:c-type cytochrome n=1 Tax=unclassified Dinoroseobacter TaxID=2620028 RepID=UPI003C7B8B4C
MRWIIGGLAGMTLALATGAVADPVDEGRQLFRDYCVTCHGMEAVGDGPMTQVLTISPPDLTRLGADNDGVFPVSRVVARIDGRMPVLGHGGPMPVFGDLFDGEAGALDSETGAPILTSRSMVAVVEYLKTLQR